MVGAAPAPDEADQLVFLTRTGQLLRYAASAVRPQGPAGGGVAGIRLAAGDTVGPTPWWGWPWRSCPARTS